MAIPRSSRSVADDLGREIRAGRYQPGSKLPSLTQLRQRYAPTSLSTIQRAMNYLKDEGLVVGVQGSGLYVAEDVTRVLPS